MELLDRYLQAVRFWLPRAQQDDIVAELGEDIRSQVEEQEMELGRKLKEAEVESILKQRGRPLLVASRYLPQQHLIGPVLFPIYRLVLSIVFVSYLAPWLVVWIVFMSFDPGYRSAHSASGALIGVWGSLWLTAFTVIGVVTIIFAALERVQSKSRFLEDWDPRKLPAVRNAKQIPRHASVIEVVANLAFIVWWGTSMWSEIIFEYSGVRIVLAPTWRICFWAFLLISVANVAVSSVNFFRPYWTYLRATIRLVSSVAGAVVFCWLLRAHMLVEISAPHLSPTRAAEITNLINTYMSRSFPLAVMACVLIVALGDVGRLVRLMISRTRLIQGLAESWRSQQ